MRDYWCSGASLGSVVGVGDVSGALGSMARAVRLKWGTLGSLGSGLGAGLGRVASLIKSSMFLQSVGIISSGPFSSRVGEGKGTVGADLVGLRSPRALWPRKMHGPGHGSAGFR